MNWEGEQFDWGDFPLLVDNSNCSFTFQDNSPHQLTEGDPVLTSPLLGYSDYSNSSMPTDSDDSTSSSPFFFFSVNPPEPTLQDVEKKVFDASSQKRINTNR
jgi:hypothetical protein